jgi:uncharacterized damage-inducible protein DinB
MAGAEVPFLGDERANLVHGLRRHRAVVVWKLQGLDDEQLRRPMTPSGTNLLGLVKHLAAVEYGWFCSTFGREVEARCVELDAELEVDPEADMRASADETTEEILAFYVRACAAADAAIDALDLDTVGTSWSGTDVSMRWVLVHMIEETARHAGHMDILRELIDGASGDHNRA